MKLGQVLDQIDTLSDDDIIFARRPWNSDSEAVVERVEEDYRVPKSITDRGFEYLLEVHEARELLESFGSKCNSAADRRDLIIHYAEYDAYPDWVYTMRLDQVLDQIDACRNDETIFAKRPWNTDSEAVTGRLEEVTHAVPKPISDRGFAYFLGVHLAKELLQDFRSKLRSPAERCNFLIHYAEYDAYPDWVVDR